MNLMGILVTKQLDREAIYNLIYDNPTYDYMHYSSFVSFITLNNILNGITGTHIPYSRIVRMAEKDLILVVCITKSRELYIHPKDVSKIIRTVLKVKKMGGFETIKKVAR